LNCHLNKPRNYTAACITRELLTSPSNRGKFILLQDQEDEEEEDEENCDLIDVHNSSSSK